MTRQVLPHMYAGGWGRVVNVSSVHGPDGRCLDGPPVARTSARSTLNERATRPARQTGSLVMCSQSSSCSRFNRLIVAALPRISIDSNSGGEIF